MNPYYNNRNNYNPQYYQNNNDDYYYNDYDDDDYLSKSAQIDLQILSQLQGLNSSFLTASTQPKKKLTTEQYKNRIKSLEKARKAKKEKSKKVTPKKKVIEESSDDEDDESKNSVNSDASDDEELNENKKAESKSKLKDPPKNAPLGDTKIEKINGIIIDPTKEAYAPFY